ncbi:MAG: hypothetical protein HC896_10865, partial [Bacteroidales bacterium]|nr:hypothetical protein [Bacteroidales bacterium]
MIHLTFTLSALFAAVACFSQEGGKVYFFRDWTDVNGAKVYIEINDREICSLPASSKTSCELLPG